MKYSEKLKSPKWQKKRLEILKRDNWECKYCKDNERQLHVHHLKYTKEPWDAKSEDLITTCIDCHTIMSTNEFIFNSIVKIKLTELDGYKFICKGKYKNGIDGFCFIASYNNNITTIGFFDTEKNKIKDFL
jgi:hypothetical protein